MEVLSADQSAVVYEVQFPKQTKRERWTGVLKYTEDPTEWPYHAEFAIGCEVQGYHGFGDVVDDGSPGSCCLHDVDEVKDTFGDVNIQMYLDLYLDVHVDVANQVLPRRVS
jgi:hypothetical protein